MIFGLIKEALARHGAISGSFLSLNKEDVISQDLIIARKEHVLNENQDLLYFEKANG